MPRFAIKIGQHVFKMALTVRNTYFGMIFTRREGSMEAKTGSNILRI
jgi:hypothetical protein